MGKHEVVYQGGESLFRPCVAVDYMLVTVDGVELYAETEADQAEETSTYDDLKSAILRQAAKKSIPVDALAFFYDD